jgi:hypothetical protein
MDRLRFVSLASLALALGSLAAPAARTDELKDLKTELGERTCKIALDDLTCVLYSLADLGSDPDLGKWVAETIPEAIAPGTWKDKGVIRYYAPKKLLVVSHTPATQAKVDAFLKSVKKSLPAANEKTSTAANTPARETAVVPADFRMVGRVRGSTASAEQSLSYPVPAPATRPKHLFHFIIRYEGEGIVDDNIVKAMKTQFQGKKKEKATSDPLIGSGSAASGGYTSSVPATVPYMPPGAVLSSPPAPLISRPPTSSNTQAPASATSPATDKKETKKADKEEKDDK